MKKKRRPFALPCPEVSARLLVSLAPSQVGMFRFLLEAYDNLACFSVLNKTTALLKIVYSPHQEQEVLQALDAISRVVPLDVRPWPLAA